MGTEYKFPVCYYVQVSSLVSELETGNGQSPELPVSPHSKAAAAAAAAAAAVVAVPVRRPRWPPLGNVTVLLASPW